LDFRSGNKNKNQRKLINTTGDLASEFLLARIFIGCCCCGGENGFRRRINAKELKIKISRVKIIRK
jgi:hypothetical protein